MDRTCLWILVLAPALTLVGCGPGTDVNTRSLREARIKWNRANVRDYNLEWVASRTGRRDHYYVFVRHGRVEEIRSVLDDGRELRVAPPDPSFYSVDGLFKTLEDDLEQAHGDRPFGAPPGTPVLLKFDADPALGFPRRYRRDVGGSRSSLALDVVRFDTNPKLVGPIPPLPPAPGQRKP